MHSAGSARRLQAPLLAIAVAHGVECGARLELWAGFS